MFSISQPLYILVLLQYLHFAALRTLLPLSESKDGCFGWSVAVEGRSAAIGAFDNTGLSSIYTYELSTSWKQKNVIIGDNIKTGLLDGPLAISRDYAIVGSSSTFDELGSVTIFFKSDNSWAHQARLTASDGQADNGFGSAVSISGNYAIIGASSIANQHLGSVFVFHKNSTSWYQQAKLTSSDGVIGDAFGSSLSLSSGYLLIGAYLHNSLDYEGLHLGSAYVFHRNDTEWKEEAALFAPDGDSSREFGYSVSLSGNYALIGSRSSRGSAFIFTRNSSSWVMHDELIASDGQSGDGFGWSVSLDGNYALIGAHNHGDQHHGSAYVFRRMGHIWVQQAKLVALDSVGNDYFGSSVSLDGSYALVGAPNDQIGYAVMFVRQGNDWIYAQEEEEEEEVLLAVEVQVDGNSLT